MNRRDALRKLSIAAAAGGANLLPSLSQGPMSEVLAQNQSTGDKPWRRGLPPAKITDIKTILTAPDRIRLVIVKIETSEPGLYGLGCATFTQRALVVQTAVEKYLKPFLIGRDV